MTTQYTVYKHTCGTTGKSYIGITNNMRLRTSQHQSPTSKCTAFVEAIIKYGWTDFTTTILYDRVTIDEANIIESLCIEQHSTLFPAGYNLTGGGRVGLLSDETKRRISNSKVGHAHSDETKRRISESMKGNQNSVLNPDKPRPRLTDQRKQQIRISKIGRPHPSFPVTCPHCGKVGNNAAMHRHHMDNCKSKL